MSFRSSTEPMPEEATHHRTHHDGWKGAGRAVEPGEPLNLLQLPIVLLPSRRSQSVNTQIPQGAHKGKKSHAKRESQARGNTHEHHLTSIGATCRHLPIRELTFSLPSSKKVLSLQGGFIPPRVGLTNRSTRGEPPSEETMGNGDGCHLSAVARWLHRRAAVERLLSG